MAFEDLDRVKFTDERSALARVLAVKPLNPQGRAAAQAEAAALVHVARKKNARRQGVAESFLKEFSLSTREGLASEVSSGMS